MASALVVTRTPELMRQPSSSSGPLSFSVRTPTSRGALEEAVQSQKAVDHDCIPFHDQHQQHFQHQHQHQHQTHASIGSSTHEHVLQTPRRGRRVGGVDLGWGSPLSAETTGQFSSSRTFPLAGCRQEKRKKTAIEASLATPRKRTAQVGTSDSISLVEASGRASAALTGLNSRDIKHVQSKADLTPEPQSPTPVLTTTTGHNAGPYDKLGAFNRSFLDHNDIPAMLPVERTGMGRVIVHRELAEQIAVSPSAKLDTSSSCSSSQERNSDGGLSSTSSSSRSTASTNATSFDGLASFPSGSLSMPYADSKPISTVHDEGFRGSMEAKNLLSTFRNSLANVAISSGDSSVTFNRAERAYQPRLGGSSAVHTEQMPTLDWPDSPTGPWSAASEQVHKAQTERRGRIARWLDEEDSGDEFQKPCDDQDTQHHPMVAKLLWDRIRKDVAVSPKAPLPQLRRSKSERKLRSPSKRQASKSKSKRKTTAANAEYEMEALLLHPPTVTCLSQQASQRRSMAALSPLSTSSLVACLCGSAEERGAMICCDGCVRWHHCSCVGLGSVESIKEEHWYCQECSDMIASGISPLSPSNASSARALSSLGGSSILGTPSFPRSATAHQLRPGAGHLPVFAQPTESPVRETNGLQQMSMSSALALAPSPQMPSTDSDLIKNRATGGRSRAERVGWHFNEPSSPLDRKGNVHVRTPSRGAMLPLRMPMSPSPRSRMPSFDMHDPMGTPFMLGMLATDPSSASTSSSIPSEIRHANRDRTPSPRPSSSSARKDAYLLATPTRHARSGRTSDWSSVRNHQKTGSTHRDLDSVRDVADVFSPSRLLQTPTSWVQHGRMGSSNGMGMDVHPQMTPKRHAREDSGASAWTFSTPTTRAFMDSAFGSASDQNPPSLIYSSSAGGTGGHYLDNAESHSMLRSWQMQSPTSSTRAATRARQVSAERHRTMTSSLRSDNPATSEGARGRTEQSLEWDAISDTDEPPSSSPFPRTPTFSDQPYQTAPHHHRLVLQGSPHSTRGGASTKRLTKPTIPSSAAAASARSGNYNAASNAAAGSEVPSAEFYTRTRMASSQHATAAAASQRNSKTPQGTLPATAGHYHHQHQTSTGTPSTNDFMAGLGLGLDFDDVVNLSF